MTDNDELHEAVLKIDLLLKRRQAMWEIPKGIAALAAAGAVFFGFVLAGVNWLRPAPPAPQQITATIHLDQPVVVKLSP